MIITMIIAITIIMITTIIKYLLIMPQSRGLI